MARLLVMLMALIVLEIGQTTGRDVAAAATLQADNHFLMMLMMMMMMMTTKKRITVMMKEPVLIMRRTVRTRWSLQRRSRTWLLRQRSGWQ